MMTGVRAVPAKCTSFPYAGLLVWVVWSQSMLQDGVAKGFDCEMHPLNDFVALGLKPKPAMSAGTGIKTTRAVTYSPDGTETTIKNARFVVVSSTTGNGDPPDNAERFWRWVHRKDLPCRYYAGMRFTVLGLGDTNYSKFCNAAKGVRTSLLRLGATEFAASAFADEVDGIDTTIDPWLAGIWPVLAAETGTKLVASAAAAAASSSPSTISAVGHAAGAPDAKEVPPGPRRGGGGGGMSLLEQMRARQMRIPAAATAPTAAPAPATAPTAGGMGLLAQMRMRQMRPQPSPKSVSSATSPAARASAALETTLPGLTPGTLHPRRCPAWPGTAAPSAAELLAGRLMVPRLSATSVRVQDAAAAPGAGTPGAAPAAGVQEVKEGESAAEERSGFSADAPVSASVRAARYLTAGGATSTRRVAHIELDASGTAIADAWGPGDALGVLCPNPLQEVEGLCRRLGVDPAAKIRLISGVGSLAAHLRRVPDTTTARAALMHCVDVRWPMKKAFVRFLAEHCAERPEAAPPITADRAAADRHCLLLLCSRAPEGKALWAQALEAQRVTLLDLLCLFPSCLPPLGGLVSLLPPLAPRFYSISSTPLDAPARISFAFTLVSYHCGVEATAPAPPSQACGATASSPADVARRSSSSTELSGSGGIVRHGLATHFLEMIASGLLRQSEASSKAAAASGRTIGRARGPARLPSLRVFLRKARDFKPPASLRWPLIMIGPGTGVSPFRGFLRHRQARLEGSESQRAAVCTGEWRSGFTVDFLEDDCEETSLAAASFLTGCTPADSGTSASADATLAAAASASAVFPLPSTAQQRAGSARSVGSAEQARRNAAAAASLTASRGRPSGIRAAGTPAGAGHAATTSQYGAGPWAEDAGLSPRAGLKALTGDTILLFGNRSPQVDFLYKEDWEELERGGALSKLCTAFSRAETGPQRYVQHRITEDGTAQRLARAILSEGAHVFVCGDGNAMAKCVHEALVKILVDFDAKERAERGRTWTAEQPQREASPGLLPEPGVAGAEQLLKRLAASGKYVRDIWIG